jgi:trans-aconitate 2-methyltransferase
MAWSPEQYLKFAQPRLRPALELLVHIDQAAPRCVYDLGCGPGNVTRFLVDRWPQAQITGVDDSTEMLAQAARDVPTVTWVNQNLDVWVPAAPPDVIYSNAALQWLPQHDRLFPRLFGQLAAGGVLAVQMPDNFQAPSHTAVADVVRSGPSRPTLEPLLRPNPVGAPAFYHRLLAAQAKTVDIWTTEYLHVLTGADPVKEWTKGTWLRPFLEALAGAQRADFEARYAAQVALAYPPQPDGTTLFPFRRLFIVAEKA